MIAYAILFTKTSDSSVPPLSGVTQVWLFLKDLYSHAQWKITDSANCVSLSMTIPCYCVA